MKVCIISNSYTPYLVGGAEVYVDRISRKLSEGHEVAVITTRPYGHIKSLWVSCHTLGRIKVYQFYPLNLYHNLNNKNKPAFLKMAWHMLDIWNAHPYFLLKAILKKERPDIAHTHNLNGLSLSVPDALKSLGIPLVHTCHDFSLLCPYATLSCPLCTDAGDCVRPPLACRVYCRLKALAMDSKPDIALFPSRSTLETYQQSRLFKKSRQEVLYYCIEPPEDEPSSLKKGEEFNVLYVGRLVKHKGVHILIDAFKRLPLPNAKLHIVGSGDYEQELKKQSSRDKRVIFHGQVNNKEIHSFYRQAAVTVVPSLWKEVLGIVILESFSVGTPAIGSNVGGIGEVIKDGYNGFVFNPGDSDKLKNILAKMMSDRESLAQLGSNALSSAGRFMIGQHITQLLGIYQEAIELNRQKVKR